MLKSLTLSRPLTRAVAAVLLTGSLAAAGTAQGQKDPSVQPPQTPPAGQPGEPKQPGSELPDNAKPAPPVPAAGAQLEIVSLKVGPTVVKRLSGFAGSFITDTADSLQITAEARVKGQPELSDAITWQVNMPPGFNAEGVPNLTGSKLKLRLVRQGGNPTGAGGYLGLSVRARVEVGGQTSERQVALLQDARDRLRQEYLDLGRTEIPGREDLIDAAQFARRFGRKYPGVTFDELNSSVNPITRDKYSAIPLSEELVKAVFLTRRAYGRPVQVTSGFRNPVRQVEVHAEVEESHHQYGRAADLYVPPSTPLAGKQVATEQDWLRLASAALQGGGRWIEPMVSCHVNTDQCHVHLDVRPGPAQSRVVTLRGQVTDPSGNPVPGARVTLAGMPAVTNPQGQYQLKHVLTATQEKVVVEAPGRGQVARDVSLVENPTLLTVTVAADPNATLLARVEPGVRDAAGTATVRLVLKNTGLSNALKVKLAPRVSGTDATLTQVLPQELESIPSGLEGSFNVTLTATASAEPSQQLQVPLEVTATYSTASGETREQRWPLSAQLDPPPNTVATPTPAAATPAARVAGVIESPARGGLDPGAALGGLLLGALAGAFSIVVVRPRRPAVITPESTPEPRADPEPEGAPRVESAPEAHAAAADTPEPQVEDHEPLAAREPAAAEEETEIGTPTSEERPAEAAPAFEELPQPRVAPAESAVERQAD